MAGWKCLQIQIQLQKEIQIQTILRPNQSQCVLGYRHQRSGCSKIPAFVVQLSTPATTASLHCASIVLLLCCCFCAHIAQSRGSRCCHSVGAGTRSNPLLTIYTLHIFLLRPLSLEDLLEKIFELSHEHLSKWLFLQLQMGQGKSKVLKEEISRFCRFFRIYGIQSNENLPIW